MIRPIEKLILNPFILCVLITLSACSAFNKTQIDISINPSAKFSDYRFAYIEMINIPEDCKYGTSLWVFEKISKNLADMNILNRAYSDELHITPKERDMFVHCSISKGLGKPRMGSHIYDFEFRYVKKINIEFLDAINKNMLAKIAYDRGFSDKLEGDVDRIFSAFKEELKKLEP